MTTMTDAVPQPAAADDRMPRGFRDCRGQWQSLTRPPGSGLPRPRGPLSEVVFAALLDGRDDTWSTARRTTADGEADRQITLWTAYELHHRGFAEVDDAAEWSPDLIAIRRDLEAEFEDTLRQRCPDVELGDDPAGALLTFAAEHDGPSIAAFVQRRADPDQVRDVLRQRSLYHLKEADAQTWVVPRLPVDARAALVELQYDEYGCGDPDRLHAELFARGLAAAGLDRSENAYVDEATVETLAINTAQSMFGLNRRLRGAAIGHLVAFEATSAVPSGRWARGLRRLSFPDELVDYYTEHVEADAVHEQLAARSIAAALLADEPGLHRDVVLGAFTCLDLESRFATSMLDRWSAD